MVEGPIVFIYSGCPGPGKNSWIPDGYLDSFIFLAGKISGLEGEILKPERTEHSEVNSKFQKPKAREDGL